jgi:hypothetical protein
MELGWLTGYTKLTDYADFGTMLIYITGDNRQSLIMLCRKALLMIAYYHQ